MANSYFVLQDSAAIVTKRFSVLSGGYFPSKSKAQNIGTTLDGRLDISLGGIYERHTYTVRVRKEEPRSEYGDYDDLLYFYSLNAPLAIPSNEILLTDHYGSEHQIVMSGEFSPQPLSVMIAGQTAWFIVLCVFTFLPDVVGSGS